jgi:TAG lipase / steryl ester hydrolase / phospholipase A2 / LPA acyltransferase
VKTSKMLRQKYQSVRALDASLATADSFEQWQELALAYDVLTGNYLWREQDESSLYDASSINMRLHRLRKLRTKGDNHGLLFALSEGIHGNMAGMGDPKLYQKALSGTKFLISEYIDEICDALRYLSPRRFRGISWADRIEFFQIASHCYGRSALMLSGGGTLGYFHFGVLKALIEQKLCPVVISGASAGAFVAAIVGARGDDEFLALFENNYLARALTENNENIKVGFGMSKQIDMRSIKRGMAKLIPDITFREAYDKTGRSINISISPAQPRQKSRLLNHIASPNVTLRSAVLASTALPGVFPPVQLAARNAQGKVSPYLPSRRWIDGSFSQDLPAKRLARMYGVNHFIVSQVMPGLGREPNGESGFRNIVSAASVAATKQIVRGSLDSLQRYGWVGPKMGTAMNIVNALLDQQYTADINIFPGYGLSSLGKLLKMMTEEEMAGLIKAGERATWPKVPIIDTTTRIGRTLDEILHAFEIDQAHWLRTAPQTDTALNSPSRSAVKGRGAVMAKRGKRVSRIIEQKARNRATV